MEARLIIELPYTIDDEVWILHEKSIRQVKITGVYLDIDTDVTKLVESKSGKHVVIHTEGQAVGCFPEYDLEGAYGRKKYFEVFKTEEDLIAFLKS